MWCEEHTHDLGLHFHEQNEYSFNVFCLLMLNYVTREIDCIDVVTVDHDDLVNETI